MNIQEMLSKMNPQMLAQGLKQISNGLTPEQLQMAADAINKSGLSGKGGQTNPRELQKQLQSNPDMIKKLAQDPNLLSKLEQIVKKS